MNCESARRLIDAFMDSELDSSKAMEVEAHLSNCRGCQSMLEARQHLSRAIKQAVAYAPAPDHVRPHLMRRTRPLARLRFGSALAALALAVGLGVVLGVWQPWSPSEARQDRILSAVLAHHRECLACSHFTDVASNDPKRIQSWFTAKLDYTPHVPAVSDQGFVLIGGRLDVVDGHTAPVVVYTHGPHHIDVFVTPSGESDSFDAERNGVHVLSWNDCGLGYWIVSDEAMQDLVGLRQDFWGRRRDR